MIRAHDNRKSLLGGIAAAVAAAIVMIPQGVPAASTFFKADLTPADVTVHVQDGKSRVVVDDPQYLELQDEGHPALPYRLVRVLLPAGHEVADYRFVYKGRTVITDSFDPALAPPMVSVDGDIASAEPLAEWLSGSGAGPVKAGRYLGTGYYHGHAIAGFAVFPLAHEDGSLILLEDITVEVDTRPAGDMPELVRRERFRDGFGDRIRQELSTLVVNPEAASSYRVGEVRVDKETGGFQPTSYPSLEGSPVDYVIITNDAMAASWQILADWKTAKGVPTVIRTVEWIEANYRNGSDQAETIRTFIKDAYGKWGVTYVLLGGDIEYVPARFVRSCFVSSIGAELPTDLYYACLDGDWNDDHDHIFGEMPGGQCPGNDDAVDLYAEVYVGRLPARNAADVALLTSKIMAYETPNETDFTNRILYLAEVLFPITWKQGDTITMNGADLAQFTYLTKMTDPSLDVVRLYETEWLYPGSIHEQYTTARDSLEAGFNHVIHVGHGFRFNMSVGDRSVMNTDADVMTNGAKLSNLYLLNCTAVAFNYFCLGEHFLLAPYGGGVSVVGATESAYPNASSYYMYEYYDLLFLQGDVNIGEAFHRSRLKRTAYAVLGDNVDLWTHYIYALLADPEMPLWTDELDTPQVAHVSNVGLGTSSIQVTVQVGGSPIDSAWVCLSKGDDDYQYGATDGAGQATFNFRAESPGDIRVVVTGRNHARYEGTVEVDTAATAYVTVNGLTVVDDNKAGTKGNGDGVIDAGETVDLWLEVANTGGVASGFVDVVLATTTPGVTISDNSAAVGVVAEGGTQVASDRVRVTFAAGVSDETAAEFDVTIKEGGADTWYDAFARLVHAPSLDLVTLRIDDTAAGNSDGVVDAGEPFSLYYGIKNFGTGAANRLSASIVDLDGAFSVGSASDAYPDLGAMGAAENSSGFILLEPDVSAAHEIEITITDDWGRAYVDTFELRPPDPPADLMFNAGLGADRLGVEWSLSTTPDALRYNVYQSSLGGGPYTKINADPVDHAVFVAVGLAPSTRYYFVATTVDGSGNESAQSLEFSGTTNPDQLAGWPIQMGLATTSSPVVGDIDGDGDLEIVQGDDKVYAWHHDGVELIDGDGDAQSWGVLTTAGDEFVSPIALARIDGNAGHEILAASRNTREVYVFDYQGNALPGWPQPVENYIRAGLVAGDINNDGVLEVIAVDERGVIYVWNGNGTEFIDGDSNPSTPGVFYRMPGNSYLFSAPAVADIDNDNVCEIVAASQSSRLFVFNDDGSIVAGFPVTLDEPVCGSPAVGDIDDDGDLEIVVNQLYGRIKAYHHDGSTLFSAWVPNNITFGPSPALADITGDGRLETFIPSSDGNLYVFQYNGAGVSGWPVQYSDHTYTESSPIVADLNGDGSLDVILGDETRLIKAWDVGGNLLDGFPLPIADAMRAVPVVEDIDRDGDVDLIAAGWDQIVYIWDFPGAHTAGFDAWPSFHGNLHNDGLHGSRISTGVGGVMFASSVSPGGGISLEWYVPASAGFVFDVQRAAVSGPDAAPGAFGTLAAGLTVEAGGELLYVDAGARSGETYVYRLADANSGEEIHMTGSIYVPVTKGDLSQNYPNPFNPVTRITYLVPDGGAQQVRLVVYDVRGARVRTLVDDRKAGGKYTVEWDGRNDQGQTVGSGVYFYRLVETNFTQTRKMLLLK